MNYNYQDRQTILRAWAALRSLADTVIRQGHLSLGYEAEDRAARLLTLAGPGTGDHLVSTHWADIEREFESRCVPSPVG